MRHQASNFPGLCSLPIASLLFLACGGGSGPSGTGNPPDSGGGGGTSPVTIGPNGGTLDGGNGLKITVPAGSLSSNLQMSAAQTNTAAPSNHGALSNLYQFGPDGTTFAQPITVTLPLPAGAPPNATIFWSQKGNPSVYEDAHGTVSGSTISAQVTHFSTGFVGALLSMANWVHRAPSQVDPDGVVRVHWAYFVPTDAWIGVPSMSGIDISSPTGDALAEFAFAYGPLIPTSLGPIEDQVKGLFSSFTIISQSPIGVSPYNGPSRTTEFTGVWLYNHTSMRGVFTVNLGYQVVDTHLMMATPAIWPAIRETLQLIQDHITYCPAGYCG